MEMSKIDRIELYSVLKERLKNFSNEEIENGVMMYCLTDYGKEFSKYATLNAEKVFGILMESNLPTDLETVIEFFESLLEEDNIDENGIVFTPRYIADYITSGVFKNLKKIEPEVSVIDPSCGCGIFLVSAASLLFNKFGGSINDIIEKYIYGIELDENNARRCSLVLKLLCAKYNGDYNNVTTNIVCADSLKCAWTEIFAMSDFRYIIGNPPYVNTHDMSKVTVRFLKENFVTTQNGVFNIFYAFIEHAMKYLSLDGTLGYIVPNNFLTIKSALKLREFLQEQKYVNTILNFGDNMLFRPVRTYNSIMFLTKTKNEELKYYVMPKVECIKSELEKIHFSKISESNLDKNGWKLVDKRTYANIKRIESQAFPIKEFIRTGIATLRDGVYLVDYDDTGFYKIINGERFCIERGIVKQIYKIPELKSSNNIDNVKRYIIFPYVKSENGYILIDENDLFEEYPSTYAYLLKQREELDSRDKGKGAACGWYAYGRTQGLNKYGKKLLFPAFSNKPQFIYVDDEDALFCNGYAVFENNKYDLDILQKVLNSKIMDYYVSNTSYAIEGGYYCYQKKYVEKFSLPCFSKEDIDYIRDASKTEIDDFLWERYGLE